MGLNEFSLVSMCFSSFEICVRFEESNFQHLLQHPLTYCTSSFHFELNYSDLIILTIYVLFTADRNNTEWSLVGNSVIKRTLIFIYETYPVQVKIKPDNRTYKNSHDKFIYFFLRSAI